MYHSHERQDQVICDLPRPTTVRKMQGFVGAVNYLSMFLPQLQDLMRPLYSLTKMNSDFVWGEEQEVLKTVAK